ncbi:uncharacterized protein LOC127881096 [Dreissena polymorpha]|uniref:Protein phosphatase 1 regulatory subunit 35 C-terminal domain-containing protein n=1 Tax=Dreissena polymorpha TaxID=45954 RepID=A0A9D4GS19_DREPO|nr:uncharacterized protein LOC127881096 [Dreissena polymorpha]KAH3822279.1 hypothetical protein DPMN_124053 [Dreissena polymorpha]
MATHFICQSSEPLPHIYQGRHSDRTHGAVSQYEVFNSANKAHTRFPAPGWDFSQSSEEDSLPLLQPVPQPAGKQAVFQIDPELCVTPLKAKSLSIFGQLAEKPNSFPDPDLTLTPEKFEANKSRTAAESKQAFDEKEKKHRVRFDLDEDSVMKDDANVSSVSVNRSLDKPYQPELYGNTEEDEDEDTYESDNDKIQFQSEQSSNSNVISESMGMNSRTGKYTVSTSNGKTVYVPIKDAATTLESKKDVKISEQSTSKSNSKSAKGSSLDTKGVKIVREKSTSTANQTSISTATNGGPVDPIASCKVPEQSGKPRKAKVVREHQYLPKEKGYTFPFSQPSDDMAAGEEHMFARPEYNSTLRMKLEADKLRDSEVDLEKALQRKLTENTKTQINEKAASLVNPDGTAFSGLVSLDVPVEEVCRQAAIKVNRAKQVRPSKGRSQGHKEPDVMEFFSAERQKESVTFSCPGIPSTTEQLSTASHWRAFDLYRHNRVWSSHHHK